MKARDIMTRLADDIEAVNTTNREDRVPSAARVSDGLPVQASPGMTWHDLLRLTVANGSIRTSSAEGNRT